MDCKVSHEQQRGTADSGSLPERFGEPKLKSVERRLTWAPDAASPEAALLVLAEALLGYAQLQVTSERRSIKETSTYREVVSHLRSVFDEGNSEEHRHIEKLTDVSKTLKAFDTDYYTIKEQAKVLIAACREDRDRQREQCKVLGNRLHDVESELFSAEAVFGQQEQELKLLEKVSYHAGALGISELRQRVHELGNENLILEAENKNLFTQIAETQKKLASVCNGETCFNAVTGDQQDIRARMAALREIIPTLQRKSVAAKKEFEEAVTREKNMMLAAKEKAAELLASYEKMKSAL